MIDPRRILESLAHPGARGAGLGGPAGGLLGALGPSLLGSVLLGRRRRPGGLLQAGTLAAVGYVAWQAWQRHQAQQAGRPAPASASPVALRDIPPQLPDSVPASFDPTRKPESALQIVQAMVAASRADGVLEPEERDRIFARVNEMQLSQEEHDYVLRLLTQAPDLEAIVRGAGSPELALETYTAAAMTVHPASRPERAWLEMLGARLGLEPSLMAEADRTVDAALTQK